FSPTFSTAGILLLPLSRLGRPQIEQMVGALTRDKAMPSAVIDHVADRADGVPLFVEELLRMMIDTGLLVERADRYELTGPISSAVIPGTLRALLTARLDRLAQAKETAQLAAALGREFSLDVLSAASPSGIAAVAAVEAQLTANGALIQALMAVRGWADPQVKDAADRSASLVQRVAPDSKHRVPTLWFLFVYHHVASNRATARALSEELVAIA